MTDIERFLGLSDKDIQERIQKLEASIPTVPGTGYLEAMAKKYQVQPWPFIIYLAYYYPSLLREGLENYAGYDGAENYHAVLEGLKEHYITWKLIGELRQAMAVYKP